jgi:hypothetical protein
MTEICTFLTLLLMSVKMVLLILLEYKSSHFVRTSSPVNIKSKLGDFVSYISLNIVGALKEEKDSFINLL